MRYIPRYFTAGSQGGPKLPSSEQGMGNSQESNAIMLFLWGFFWMDS
jgi:hypothetical protein